MPNLFEFLEQRRPVTTIGLAFAPFFVLQGLFDCFDICTTELGKERATTHHLG